MVQRYMGGSFAPPLSDAKLAEYRTLITSLPAQSQVRDAMEKLCTCCVKWWYLPESSGEKVAQHPSGRGLIIPLDKPIAEALYDHIPWKEELRMYGALFDTIEPKKEKALRDAAHHLLWHCVELELDREPITADKL